MSLYSKEQLTEHILNLGVNQGDTVFVRAGLRKINTKGKNTFLEALIDAVGPEGSILTLAFNNHYYYPFFDKNKVFTPKGYTDSGSFPKQIIQHPGGKRSKHPTCSFASIGKNASFLTDNHDQNSTSYLPIKKLIELDGKMLLVGCLEESPGFTTVHYAQETLGLSTKSIIKNLTGIYYKDGDQIKRFFRRDIGGCSLGFGKLYEYYINKGKLKHGKIGDADSLIISAKDAYTIDYERLKKNPKLALCNNPSCTLCRATWTYNKKDMFCFFLLVLPKKIIKKVLRK